MGLDPKVIPMVMALIKIIKDNKDLIFKALDNVTEQTANEVDDEVVQALAKLFGVELPAGEQLQDIAEALEVTQTKYDNKKETGEKLASSDSLVASAEEIEKILNGSGESEEEE